MNTPEIYKAGYEAGKAGETSNRNPYYSDDRRWAIWQSGWDQGTTEFLTDKQNEFTEMRQYKMTIHVYVTETGETEAEGEILDILDTYGTDLDKYDLVNTEPVK